MSGIIFQPSRTLQPRGNPGFANGVPPLIALNFTQVDPQNGGIKGQSSGWSLSSGASVIQSSAGVAYKNTNATAGSLFGAANLLASEITTNSAWAAATFVGGAYVSQGSGINSIVGYADATDFTGLAVWINSSSVLQFGCQMVGLPVLTGPTLVAGRVYHCVWGRDDAGNYAVWINGSLYASASGTNSNVANLSNERVAVGGHFSNAARAYSGSVSLFLLNQGSPFAFGRKLSENLWQIYAPLPRRLWVGAAAVGGASNAPRYFHRTQAGMS